MKKNIKIILKVIVVAILLVNLPYPKVYSEVKNEETSKEVSESTKVSQTTNKKNGKSIYIYNTHQSEGYQTNSVVEGSKYLMKLLESKGYEVIYETNDFEKYKKERNIDYRYSYTVSRLFTNQAISNHGKFDMLIDFHRDSVKKSATTLTYNSKSYAKLMFVVGKTSSNYPTTKTEAQKLASALDKKVPGISRGVYVKNSHYNQQVAKNMFLIEVGAHENTYAEVKNSLVVLASVIDSYLS